MPLSPKQINGPKTRQDISRRFVADASVSIKASPDKVWKALTDPEMIKQYMFGTNVSSEWKQGGPIVWHGIWQDKTYEDKGNILKLEPNHIIQYTHFSPLSGELDLPENYHKITIKLTGKGEETKIELSQDNNETEQAQKHSEKNWKQMLETLKRLLEK